MLQVIAPQYALFARRLMKPLSKLTSRGKPSTENLLAESSNNQLLAKFQGLWGNDSDTNILYYHRNCKHEIFNAAKTSSHKRTSKASLERGIPEKEATFMYCQRF